MRRDYMMENRRKQCCPRKLHLMKNNFSCEIISIVNCKVKDHGEYKLSVDINA